MYLYRFSLGLNFSLYRVKFYLYTLLYGIVNSNHFSSSVKISNFGSKCIQTDLQ